MRASMHQPRPELAEVLYGIGFMSTLDEAWPPPQPHLNRFPAMVYCSLTLILDGAVARLEKESGEALDGWLVSGPRTRPVTSMSLAPVRSLSAILYPDAFLLLTGIAPGTLQDRDEPAGAWLDAGWDAWPTALAGHAGDEAAQAAWIEEWLLERWQRVRAGWDPRLAASLRAIAGDKLSSAAGKLHVGERQVQRRYRERIGLSPAQARRLQRMNEAVYALRDPAARPDTLALLAAELGYADQAHMARELRELAGLPPSQLEERIATDRDYWAYRL